MITTETAPRTKDEQHEIVFTTGAHDDHDFALRSAFEGRRLWEIMRVLNMKNDRAKSLAKNYPQFLFDYDCIGDAERIFDSISVPHQGVISRDRIIENSTEYPVYEGSHLLPPFIPIFYRHSRGLELSEQAQKRMAQREVYLWGDSPNKLMCPARSAYEAIGDEFPEVKRHDSKDNREALLDLIYKLRTKCPALKDIIEDTSTMKGLENLAEFHVLEAFTIARSFQNDSQLCIRAPSEESYEGKKAFCVRASPELMKRLADSAVALCKEYLSEMK